MAITASQLTTSQTLEEFRLEYNKLQDDVTILKDNPTFGSNLVFEGAIADAHETTLSVVNPTADRTVLVPDSSGTIFLSDTTPLRIADGGTIGSVSDADSMTIASTGVITFSQKNNFTLGMTVNDGQTIGSVSTAAAMTIASTGIVTFIDDILIKDDGTIGSASATTAMTIGSGGIVTFVDDIIIKDVGTIGSATTPGAMTIAANGTVTFAVGPVYPDGSIVLLDIDIDGGTDIGADLVDADLIIVDDGANGTNRKSAVSRIKTYIADVTLTTPAQPNITSLGTLTTLTVDNVIINGATVGHTGDTDLMTLADQLVTVAGALTATGVVTAGGFTIGSAVINEADLEAIDGITAGTAAASKALVLDANGDIVIADGDKFNFGGGSDMIIYHDAANSYITNKTGIMKLATETSGIAVTIGHTTSEVTIGDNLTVAGNLTVQGTQTVVDTVTMNAANAIIFEGATPDEWETTLTITDPTADRTITLPNETGTVHTSGGSITIPDAGTIGSASSTSAITIASNGVVSFSSHIKIADAGTIGSASATDAMTIASTGIVTFKDDILLKDAGTIGVASSTSAITIASTGIVSFVDDIAIKDGGTIGTATDADSITIASDGVVTLSQRSVHNAGITINNAGEIGSVGDPDAMSITNVGVVTFSQRDIHSAGITLADDGQIGSASDADSIAIASTGLVSFSQGVSLIGDEMELRWYEGSNYVGFAAHSTLAGNQIWKLPVADASSSGDALVSDGAGNLSFSGTVGSNAASFTLIATNTTDATHFPVFVDTATGNENPRTDTGYTYNPNSGTLTSTIFAGNVTGNLTGTVNTAAQGSITSLGTLTSLVIADAGTIGSASDTDAMTISSAGVVTFSSDIVVTGTTTLNGNLVLGDAAADTLTIGATIAGATPLVFEGGTPNDHETSFAFTNPTADRTITFPDQTGTVHTSGGSIQIPDGGTIGTATDADSMTIASAGVVTFSQIPILPASSIPVGALVDDSITEAKMADDAISSVQLKTLSTLLIKNSSGTTLKTMHTAGA